MTCSVCVSGGEMFILITHHDMQCLCFLTFDTQQIIKINSQYRDKISFKKSSDAS